MGFVAAAAVATATSLYSADQGRKVQHQASDRAQANAKAAGEQQTREVNAANAKAPDVNALLAAQQASGKGGPGSTMLTGPSGVDPSLLTLGRNTLLGGGGGG